MTARREQIWPEIRFRPDGTATDSEFLLVDEKGGAIIFRVRGLTGTVTVVDASSEQGSGVHSLGEARDR